MSASSLDQGVSPYTDMKKMYASHVLENVSLSRQKSDIDLAKAKKMQELAHNEQIFLRKYSKYATPAILSRRRSFGYGDMRNIETKAKLQRPQSQMQTITTDKYFGRESVSNECSYSFETWNRLVDSEASIIETQKNDILFDEKRSIPDDEHSDNYVDNNRRHSLKPSLKCDDKTMSDKSYGNGRRHTICFGNHMASLVTLNNSKQKDNDRKKSHDKDVPFTIRKEDAKSVSFENIRGSRKKSFGRRFSASDIRNVKNVPRAISKRNMANSFHSVQDDMILESEYNLVPNATIVVRADPKDETFNDTTATHDGENSTVMNTPSSSETTLDCHTEEDIAKVNENKVSEHLEINSLRSTTPETPSVSRSVSRCSSRRGSLSISDLKLLIDSHQGRSKLRYIAKLAVKLEKEEQAKNPKPPVEDKIVTNVSITDQDLSKCRYLRCVSQTSMNENDDM